MVINSEIKLISFDVWNTLMRTRKDKIYREKRAESIRDALAPTADMQYVYGLIEKAKREYDDLTDSTGTQYGFEHRIQRVWDLLPGDIRIPAVTPEVLDAINAVQADLIIQYPPEIIEANLADTIAQLKARGLKIAVISNTGFVNGVHLRAGLAAVGIWENVDFGLFSDEVGVSKPSPEIFQQLVDLSGLRPEEILHVGDNFIADYQGATSFGMRGVHLSQDSDATVRVNWLRELLS